MKAFSGESGGVESKPGLQDEEPFHRRGQSVSLARSDAISRTVHHVCQCLVSTAKMFGIFANLLSGGTLHQKLDCCSCSTT